VSDVRELAWARVARAAAAVARFEAARCNNPEANAEYFEAVVDAVFTGLALSDVWAAIQAGAPQWDPYAAVVDVEGFLERQAMIDVGWAEQTFGTMKSGGHGLMGWGQEPHEGWADEKLPDGSWLGPSRRGSDPDPLGRQAACSCCWRSEREHAIPPRPTDLPRDERGLSYGPAYDEWIAALEAAGDACWEDWSAEHYEPLLGYEPHTQLILALCDGDARHYLDGRPGTPAAGWSCCSGTERGSQSDMSGAGSGDRFRPCTPRSAFPMTRARSPIHPSCPSSSHPERSSAGH
jgi:hypothetical protein